ncbi:phage minor head protein [Deinococcus peraridilitoris]|uniref:Phage head morphogenesis protein, SPP1 gp7 n=1 Tax=Deinococcus peraridilitoris (strain DSM 19664 / LMG 22246 / CIP 109416 / KR-200) TaxID=937777 RepID=K9ZYT3_DEIPD|nr:phage minor head protein [Deinococcus peraridilitoris]AFZ66077.1 phage head morphogenesis protein, SPP1 gp7 [Deinococcus peraridilitoris DSM 19664]
MTPDEFIRSVRQAYQRLDWTQLEALLQMALESGDPAVRAAYYETLRTTLEAMIVAALTPPESSPYFRARVALAVKQFNDATAFAVLPEDALDVARVSDVRFQAFWQNETLRFRQEAQSVLIQVLERGTPHRQAVKLLKDRASVSTSRAKAIVRTELAHAYNAGAARSADKALADGADLVKIWRATLSNPQRRRENHQRLNGQTREIREPFSNGLMFPHGPMRDGSLAPASEVINCTCLVTYRRRENA